MLQPSPTRHLHDRMEIRALIRTFPPRLVDEVLAEHQRRMPRSVLYTVLAQHLLTTRTSTDILRLLAHALDTQRRPGWQLPNGPTALAQAHQRLGPGPLKSLFGRLCHADSAQTRYRRWRLITLHEVLFALPPTHANVQHYGGPHARLTTLTAYGTPTTLAARITPHHATDFSGVLQPGTLLFATPLPSAPERLWERWRHFRSTGADLVWEVGQGTELPVHTPLDDGTYLTRPTSVRVLHRSERLITTLTDPLAAPGNELVTLHHHQHRATAPARSDTTRLDTPTPRITEQHIWAELLIHHHRHAPPQVRLT
ncbi:transposase domain-containing protein [Streptomyces harbinensis]|nr:transposase domain-containing protein [Streptomyces sp. XM4011]QKV71835.1 transposase domain-containing protein [Streptomyces harbinensis]